MHSLDITFFPRTNRVAGVHVDSLFRVFNSPDSPKFESCEGRIEDPNLEHSTGEQIVISNNEEYIAIHQDESNIIHCWSWQENQVPFQLQTEFIGTSMIDIGFSGDSTRLVCVGQAEGKLEIYVWSLNDHTLQLELDSKSDLLYAGTFTQQFDISHNETGVIIQGWTVSSAERRIWKLDCISGDLTTIDVVGHSLVEFYEPYLFYRFDKVFRMPLLYQDYTCCDMVGNYLALGYDDGKVLIMDCSCLIKEESKC